MKKDLYELVTQDYWNISKEDIKDIAKEVIFWVYSNHPEEYNDMQKEIYDYLEGGEYK